MGKTLMIAAAAALLASTMLATPAAASGYVGLQYGDTDLDGGADFELWHGEAEFGWNKGRWGAQVRGQLGNADTAAADVDYWSLNGHVYFEGGNWRLGGVIATLQLDVDGGPDFDEWAVGMEGMYDFTPDFNAFGSFTVGESDFIGSEFDTWNLDVGVNFYPTQNIRIGAIVGTGNIDGSVGETDTSTYGINGEFKPWSAPVSITLAWSHFEIDSTPYESDSFRIGARWNFGGGTVRERNNATPFNTPTGLDSRLFGIY